jgi:hypothetical protein
MERHNNEMASLVDKNSNKNVGIYVRNGINCKVQTDLESYKLKTFENIMLEIQYQNKHILISNIYRSPNPPPLTTISEHLDNFIETLDSHWTVTALHTYLLSQI